MFDISVLIIGIVTNCALSSGAIQRPEFGQKIIAFCVQILVGSVTVCKFIQQRCILCACFPTHNAPDNTIRSLKF